MNAEPSKSEPTAITTADTQAGSPRNVAVAAAWDVLMRVRKPLLLVVLAIGAVIGAVFMFEAIAQRAQNAAAAKAPATPAATTPGVATPAPSVAAPGVATPTSSLAAPGVATPAPSVAAPGVATPTPKMAAVAQPPGAVATHWLAPGETLSMVALRYDVPIEQLGADNGVAGQNRVRAGHPLQVRAKAADVRTIRPGDTLSGLARQYNLEVPALLALNPQITNPDRIIAGGQLRITPARSP